MAVMAGRGMKMKFADIIVPLAVEGVYTYSVPPALEKEIEVGALVLVAFAGNKKYTGIICRLHDRKPENYQTKPIEGIAEERVKFSEFHLRFLQWVGDYYMATMGEVVKAALPVIFRLESFTSITRTSLEVNEQEVSLNETALLNFLNIGEYVSLKDAEKYLKIRNGMAVVRSLLDKGYVQVKETVDEMFREKTERVVKWAKDFEEEELGRVLDSLKRASVQYAMLCRWIEKGVSELEKSAFVAEIGNSVAALKSLCEKQILIVEERAINRLSPEDTGQMPCNALSEKQDRAFKDITGIFEERDCVLLQGVTSSGKTEVYIHLIREYIEKGAQVLYMLPEIALTIQIVKRLQRVFGDNIGIYHSGMSDRARAELWRRQCGEHPYPVILGVRSSVFLPFRELGLIIIDEEHDASYKQKEPAPRYNGRDAAIMLAKTFGAKVLLGSATPSFETYFNARSGKYGFACLNSRFGEVQMPEIKLADMGEARRKKQMKGSFTPLLIQEMKQVLEEGKQVILFQNRRGYSTYVQCDTCGDIPRCKHCDVSLTYYKQRNILSCRYCGSLSRLNEVCSHCGTGHYRERTPGTERIEEEVEQLFPGKRVARMDIDVMSSKSRFRSVIDDFEQGKTDVLIGTQMVTKGLDFENVKLVGVMDADSMINFPDFRAEERAYCMLMQVSGRSGRKGERGKVVIQAGDMKNRVYAMLTGGEYQSFFTQLADERKFFAYPPYSRLIRIELRHKDLVTLRNAGNLLAGQLREILANRVFGPAVPDVSRIGEQHRLQFILKIEHGASFVRIKMILKDKFTVLHRQKEYGSVRVFCDVDPQ